MAHTKGPWQASGNIDSEAGVVSADGKWIVEPQSMWTEEDKANLRLIAAAPELYEALKQIAALEHMIFGDAVGGAYMAVSIAEQAITKAKAGGK